MKELQGAILSDSPSQSKNITRLYKSFLCQKNIVRIFGNNNKNHLGGFMKAVVVMCAMFLGLSFAHANQEQKNEAKEAQKTQQEAVKAEGQEGVIKQKKATKESSEKKEEASKEQH